MKFSSFSITRDRKVIKELLIFIFTKMFRREVEVMAVIYATLIIKGKKTISEVPEKLREQVKTVLIDLDVPELAE